MPFVGRRRPIAFDTIGEMATKSVHPFPDRLPADRHTLFGEQVLDICCAEREAVVDPDRIGDDLAWEAVTFQAEHGGWRSHRNRLDSHETPNNLAVPIQLILRFGGTANGPSEFRYSVYLSGPSSYTAYRLIGRSRNDFRL